jgi:hypothetical protein
MLSDEFTPPLRVQAYILVVKVQGKVIPVLNYASTTP